MDKKLALVFSYVILDNDSSTIAFIRLLGKLALNNFLLWFLILFNYLFYMLSFCMFISISMKMYTKSKLLLSFLTLKSEKGSNCKNNIFLTVQKNFSFIVITEIKQKSLFFTIFTHKISFDLRPSRSS